MKKKQADKLKRAGVWNIVCGVLTSLAFIGFYVALGFGFMGSGDEIAELLVYGAIFVFIGMYLWEAFMIFPFFMILTGAELISKHKKGAGVRLLIVFNVLMKLLSAFLSGIFGVSFFLILSVPAMAYGAYLIVTTVLTLVSMVLDIPALFAKEKVEKGH